LHLKRYGTNSNLHVMKTLKITDKDRLKALRKVNRETMHTVKPMVTTDKKKKCNQQACRTFRYTSD
ncbi:MAG: hypothetical protein ACC656_08980, partial [Candidatus Heimdallarchaeota archaeon]